MAKYIAGFIGCGNMGGPIIIAVSKVISPEKIAVTGKTPERANRYAAECGTVSTTTEDVVMNSKYIFICVKPQVFPELFEEIRPMLKARNDRFVLISPAAGLTLDSICEMAGKAYPVIRCMPNLPVSVGEGMTTYCVNERITNEDISDFLTMMKHSGQVDRLEEEQMNAGCAVAGCGPAFVYMFIDAMAEGGLRSGLSREQSIMYAIQTLIGSSKLLRESGETPENLKVAVCSPGGSTIEGVRVLENGDLRTLVSDAVTASFRKNIALGQRK